jgi:monovalent cation/hydrogen antiporter
LPADYFKSTNHSKPSGNVFIEFSKLQLDLITIERQVLTKLHISGKVSDEIWRKIEREIDLEETKLRMEIYEIK